MKRFLIYVLAILMVSCSKETNNHSTITFNAVIDQLVITKSAPTADQLIVGVFDNDGNPIEEYKRVVALEGGKFSFTLDLVNTFTYKVVLFAQKADAWVNSASFTTAGMKNIDLASHSTALNQEDDRAFIATQTITVDGSAAFSVSLTGAWAQVNVLSSADITSITNVGLTLTDVPAYYNALTGTASGSRTLTVSPAAKKGGTLTVNGTDYNYLGFAYVPTGTAKTTTDATVTLDGTPTTITNLPLQGNYRTNIIKNF